MYLLTILTIETEGIMNQQPQRRMELQWGRGRSSGGGAKNNTAVFCVGAVMNGLNNGMGLDSKLGINERYLEVQDT